MYNYLVTPKKSMHTHLVLFIFEECDEILVVLLLLLHVVGELGVHAETYGRTIAYVLRERETDKKEEGK